MSDQQHQRKYDTNDVAVSVRLCGFDRGNWQDPERRFSVREELSMILSRMGVNWQKVKVLIDYCDQESLNKYEIAELASQTLHEYICDNCSKVIMDCGIPLSAFMQNKPICTKQILPIRIDDRHAFVCRDCIQRTPVLSRFMYPRHGW